MSASTKNSRLTRPRYPMPFCVRKALLERGLMSAYRLRPPYQPDDYVGWITRAKLPGTRQKRLEQMLEELASGDAYMKLLYKAKTPRHRQPRQRPSRNRNGVKGAHEGALL